MGNYNADPFPDLDKLRTVAFGYRLANVDTLKIDQFSTTGTNKVYHFVRKIGSTNLLILVEPSEIPS